MDFEIIFGIGGEGKQKGIATDINQILPLVNQELSQWNNFEDNKDFNILIRKVENDTETLGVNIKEIIETKDTLNRS